jgi:hypothetical protein
MITDNLSSIKDRTLIFLPDDGALLAIAEHGIEALDWLFLPGAQVVTTDGVRHELLRDRAPDEDDYSPKQRPVLALWFERNVSRISVVPSEAGERFLRDVESWERSGHRDGGAPAWDWSDNPRAAMAVGALEAIPSSREERVLVVANHDGTRAAIRRMLSDTLSLTGTARFIGMIAGEFGIQKASGIVARDFAA